MTSEEFVKAFKKEKDSLLEVFTNPESGSVAAKIAAELKASTEKGEKIDELIECLLTDTFYTILLGLDGSASIGGIQKNYTIRDEDGNLITEGGELEEYAFEEFQSQ